MNPETNQTGETEPIATPPVEAEQPAPHVAVPVSSQLLVLAVLLLMVFGAGIIPTILADRDTGRTGNTATVPHASQSETSEQAAAATDPFTELNLTAEAAYLFDITTGDVLYRENEDAILPLASLTKLMTAMLAYELASADTSITVSVEALLQDGANGLRDGETFTLIDLIDFTLLTSSNDAAFAIAEVVGATLDPADPATAFVQAMNIRARELGLTNTSFRNPTGLDISEDEAGAYGTARDIATLMTYIAANHPLILERTREVQTAVPSTAALHDAMNTNQRVTNIPGVIGSKTGFTTLAGGNLAVVFDAGLNRPVVAVVLGSSWSGRFYDVETLSTAARQALSAI
jgi:D-alanyl-D-alanine carboxypeptidase